MNSLKSNTDKSENLIRDHQSSHRSVTMVKGMSMLDTMRQELEETTFDFIL